MTAEHPSTGCLDFGVSSPHGLRVEIWMDGLMMSREKLRVRDDQGRWMDYRLDVFQEGEHWTSTLARLDAAGGIASENVAPRFYGTTQEQARRRMVAILDNQYEEVEFVSEDTERSAADE